MSNEYQELVQKARKRVTALGRADIETESEVLLWHVANILDRLETCARCDAKRDKVDMAHYSRGDVHLAYCHPGMSTGNTCYTVASRAGFPENEEK